MTAFFRWLVNVSAGAIVALTSLLLCISICILYFKLTGRLAEGAMFFGMQTPSYHGLIVFQILGLLIVVVCLFVRASFGQKRDFGVRRKSRSG